MLKRGIIFLFVFLLTLASIQYIFAAIVTVEGTDFTFDNSNCDAVCFWYNMTTQSTYTTTYPGHPASGRVYADLNTTVKVICTCLEDFDDVALPEGATVNVMVGERDPGNSLSAIIYRPNVPVTNGYIVLNLNFSNTGDQNQVAPEEGLFYSVEEGEWGFSITYITTYEEDGSTFIRSSLLSNENNGFVGCPYCRLYVRNITGAGSVCFSQLDCGASEICGDSNLCVAAPAISEVPCLVPSDCSEGSTCVEGECQVVVPTTCTIDDEGEDCDSNDICNPITEECETAHDCVTTTSCESQGLEGYSCFTSEPGEGVCRPSVGTDPEDNDEDNDGVDDDVDPCVGSSSDCDAPDSGSSCEDELNGLVCDPGDECLGGTYSAVSTELNCCAGVNPSCSRVSLAVALGTSIRYTRACSSTNGEALVTVTSPGGADLTSDQCLAIGVNTNQLVPNTPFKCQYREQDWNCGELNLGPQAAGPSVFGYGLIGLLITIGIVIGFYFTRNRKLLKC